eukprot:4194156-Prymnesium_polylepis.1
MTTITAWVCFTGGIAIMLLGLTFLSPTDQQVDGAQREEIDDGKPLEEYARNYLETPQGPDAGISEYLPTFHLETPGSPCKPLTPSLRPTCTSVLVRI